MKKIFTIAFLIIAILLLPIFVVAFFSNNETAFADSLTLIEAKCLDFEGNEIDYDINNLVYGRRIVLTYNIFSPKYSIEVFKNGTTVAQTVVFEATDATGSYEIVENGELTIRCYAVDGNGMRINHLDIQVKSDNLAPKEAIVSRMEEWKRYENGFLFKVQSDEDEGNAGIEKIDIDIVFENNETEHRSISSSIANDAFMIYRKCNISISVYDKVGNVRVEQYLYDKFDSTPPSDPSFTFIPNVEVGENTNGYAKEYTVRINYGEDFGSGIKENSMKYNLNGQLYDYEGGLILNEQKNYSISAYYQDNAGNISNIISAKIKNIDRIMPKVEDVRLIINLVQETPYTLTLVCKDAESGIKGIEVQGMDIDFQKSLYNVYIGNFENLDKAGLNITVSDNVGNFQTTNISTYHFGNVYLQETVEEYHNKFLNLDSSQYSQDAWDKIVSKYMDYNILLMADDSVEADFINITKEIDEAIIGEIEYKYTIKSVPEGINGQISYSIIESDINNLKKGDELSMTLEEIEGGTLEIQEKKNQAKALGDYDPAIVRLFKLSFSHNDEEITYDLTQGATINMSVPIGYEERYFNIINLDTNEKVKIDVMNNKITFIVHKKGNFALIIEGEENTTLEIQGINIFGKMINWWSFGGVVVGSLALAITLIIIISKRR